MLMETDNYHRQPKNLLVCEELSLHIDKLACREDQFARMCTMNSAVEWSCDKCSTEDTSYLGIFYKERRLPYFSIVQLLTITLPLHVQNVKIVEIQNIQSTQVTFGYVNLAILNN